MSTVVKVQPVAHLVDIYVAIGVHISRWGNSESQHRAARADAEVIARLVRSIASEQGDGNVAIREEVTMVCPLCDLTWEIDPEDGLPCCCSAAQESWKGAQA